MMTVTGACSVLTAFPGDTQPMSVAFAAADVTNTNRAGQQLADVGLSFRRSYSACSVLSGTGSGDQRLWERASRNSVSSAASSSDFLICRLSFLGFRVHGPA